MSAAYEHCQSLVRERDYDRFLSNLFAPAEKRPHLFALHAFESEIANVADAVREPMAGEIRYQWWRDVIAGDRAGEAEANPVSSALLETIAVHQMPRDMLLAMIEQHGLDLVEIPPDTNETLLAYIDATAAASIGLSVRILAGDVPELAIAALAAGRAIGIAKLLADFARNATRQRLFVPLDLLAKHSVNTRSVLAGENSDGLRAALRELRARALLEIENLRRFRIPNAALPAFLPAVSVPKRLASMVQASYDPFRTPLETSRLRRQFAIWRAARSGTI